MLTSRTKQQKKTTFIYCCLFKIFVIFLDFCFNNIKTFKTNYLNASVVLYLYIYY